MSLWHTPLDRRRGWKSVTEIGSPWRLVRVVRALSERERSFSQRRSTDDIRAKDLAASKRTVRSFFGLFAMKRTMTRYTDRIKMPLGVSPVEAVLDRYITEKEKDGAIDRAFEVLKAASLADYDAKALVARRYEQEQGRPSEALLDPDDLNVGANAFDTFRRGVLLEAQGNSDEALRMHARALEAEPAFSLALRHRAKLMRGRDPVAAARLYSQTLEFIPREYYGDADALHVLAVYYNFLLVRRGEEFVAIPAAIGKIDFSSSRLKSPLRRFTGLLLMRLRLRAVGTESSVIVPEFELSSAAVSASPPVAARTSPDVASSSRKALYLFVRRVFRGPALWLARKSRLFQFVLADASMDGLKHQIDLVDREWLSRTAVI